jgi:hypothetical protein
MFRLKFVFEAGGQEKFEANLKEKIDRVNAAL